jgi:hypothetical protein
MRRQTRLALRDACAITDPEDLDAEVEKCASEMSVIRL